MLIFDELKKNDPQLRFVAAGLAAGFLILLTGLWWVQIVSGGEYKSHLETQSYRTIRIPAMRGKILDCQGRVLAENSPRYNLDLYFDDLSADFQAEYWKLRPPRTVNSSRPIWEFWKRSSSVKKAAPLTRKQISDLEWQARYDVAGNVVNKMSQTIGRPLTFDYKSFWRAYLSSLYVPYPIAQALDSQEVARFEENYSGTLGVDLDVQTTRVYPLGKTAAHVIGYVTKDDSSTEDEDAFFNYRMPDYKGVIGVEGAFDKPLHGHAGEEFVMVNNYGYRQTQNIGSEPEAGHNVVLTIDLDLQQVAEQSILKHHGVNALASVVVMNARTGDVLVMDSAPAIDPNYFTKNLPPDQMDQESALMVDTNLTPQINRATYAAFLPGSIFKPIVGLAALEHGMDPNAVYEVQPDPADRAHGCIFVGRRKIRDTAPPGEYDFKRAIERSSNAYFIHTGLNLGIQNVILMGEKFHLGERTGVFPKGQESRGIFPTLQEIDSPDWRDGDSANIDFGQGQLAVTPMQVAVAYCALANGGTVLWPRLVARIEPQDPNGGEAPTIYPSGVVRDRLNVSERNIRIVQDAMLGETEDIEGTGHNADVPGLSICGKTGTAQIKNEKGELLGYNWWFASFAPFENPKYVVIVTVQKFHASGSGGIDCAPIAHDVYAELVKKDPTILHPVARN
ncbi:MAG TPA: penicillin-binding transpeptidase domain-containing protein [Verrucomicrobiae bacterium]|nr:penicillin-binding transpeptidase domain-containing protein [Verrucomicrobiae bacterium]